MAAEDKYLLHQLIWKNQPDQLRTALQQSTANINTLDIRGNTPMHVAVMLNRVECIQILIEFQADLVIRNKNGYFVMHEARSVGNREVLKQLLVARRVQMHKYFMKRAQAISKQLAELDDFYMEMRWEFSSWVPLLSRFCPFDVYKIHKKGNCMRVDTTLVGFEHLTWLRGQMSFMYVDKGDGDVQFLIVDHEKKIFQRVDGREPPDQDEERVNVLMNTAIRTGDLNSSGVSFIRKRTGLLGLGSGKTEMVGEYESDVYVVEGVKVKQITRNESQDPKLVPKVAAAPVQPTESTDSAKDANLVDKSLVDLIEHNDNIEDNPEAKEKILKKLDGKKDDDVEKFVEHAKKSMLKYKPSLLPPPEPSVTEHDYFNPNPKDVKDGFGPYVHIGRPIESKVSTLNLKCTMWMSSSFPLFVEQLFPLMEIMSPSNEHFARLRDFIDLKLPRGFPVKIEIPLFGVLTARITFQGYKPDFEGKIDGSMFIIPEDYKQGDISWNKH